MKNNNENKNGKVLREYYSYVLNDGTTMKREEITKRIKNYKKYILTLSNMNKILEDG